MANTATFLFVALIAGCATSPLGKSNAPDPQVVGAFTDDYNTTHTITATEWRHGTRARYHVVKWNASGQYLIARNDSTNPGDAGLWTRIDWLRLEGMPPWTWGYCMTAYNAPSADSAEATRIANRAAPRTGCNGFPFTRMRPGAPPR